MTPFEQIQELYRKYLPDSVFLDDLEIFIEAGYVISTPEVFAMGHPEPHESVWHVFAFAGDLSKALPLFPYSLKWIEFARRGKPSKRYPFDRICAKIKNLAAR